MRKRWWFNLALIAIGGIASCANRFGSQSFESNQNQTLALWQNETLTFPGVPEEASEKRTVEDMSSTAKHNAAESRRRGGGGFTTLGQKEALAILPGVPEEALENRKVEDMNSTTTLGQKEALAILPGVPEEALENRKVEDMNSTAKRYAAEHPPALPEGPGGAWSKAVKVWPRASMGSPRILCMVMLAMQGDVGKAETVAATWGAKCDRLVFLGDWEDRRMGVVKVEPLHKGRGSLVSKIGLGWEHVMREHGQDYDWFVKGDTDSLFIIENLRHYVLQELPQTDCGLVPRYIGQRCKFSLEDIFNGGGGYAINRAALTLLNCTRTKAQTCTLGTGQRASLWRHQAALPQSSPGNLKAWGGFSSRQCSWDKEGSDDDVMTAICLALWGVFPHDTRDALGREFFTGPAEDFYSPSMMLPAWQVGFNFGVVDWWGRSLGLVGAFAGLVAEHPVLFHGYKEPGALRRAYQMIYGSSADKSLTSARQRKRLLY